MYGEHHTKSAPFALLSSVSGHSPTLLAQRAMLSVSFRLDRTSRLHLPAPLRSPGITKLHRYCRCSASCAEARRRSLFCSSRRAVPVSFLLVRHAGLLASRVPSLQSLLSPTTQLPPMIALTLCFAFHCSTTPPRGDAVTVGYRPM
jgi:hypothetical protein